MIGKLSVGDQIGETHIIFRNINKCEFYINIIDEGYDAKDVVFNGFFYIINIPHFNLVNKT